jgi:hypothetical protein
MQQPIAKVLIVTGLVLVIIGITWYFFGNRFTWLGRLPGDIRIEKENIRFYFPITTMILISIVLSLLLYLARKFF